MHEIATNELSILIILAFVIFISPYLAKFTRIPIAPIEIIFGTILGYFGLIGDSATFKLVAEVGFFYLMFLAGTEIDIRALIKTDKHILRLSLLYISILYVIAGIAGVWSNAIFLTFVVVPVMSVGVLSTLFKEYGKNEPWLNTAMIAGGIGEVISIALLTLMSAYIEFGSSAELFSSIYYLILFIVLCVFVFKGLEILFWWYPNIKILLMPHDDKAEKDIRLSMALFFSTVAVMIYLNLEIVLGAFIAGSFIATFFNHKKDLPHKLGSFGFGFLVPIFFVYIGTTVDLGYLFMPGVLDNAVKLMIFMTIIRVAASMIFIKRFGLYDSILFGLSLSMPLTLLVAVATVAYNAGNIPKELYFAFIIASIFEAIISMILIKFTNYLKFRLKELS